MYSREELKSLKQEFWESFGTYCSLQPELRHRKKMWILYNTKIKGVELKFDVTRDGAYVILEVNHKDEDDRLEMLERLEWYKDDLERDFPQGLEWHIHYVRETSEEVARIWISQPGIDFHRREDWGAFFSFMAKNMRILERNFLSIAEYIRID